MTPGALDGGERLFARGLSRRLRLLGGPRANKFALLGGMGPDRYRRLRAAAWGPDGARACSPCRGKFARRRQASALLGGLRANQFA